MDNTELSQDPGSSCIICALNSYRIHHFLIPALVSRDSLSDPLEIKTLITHQTERQNTSSLTTFNSIPCSCPSMGSLYTLQPRSAPSESALSSAGQFTCETLLFLSFLRRVLAPCLLFSTLSNIFIFASAAPMNISIDDTNSAFVWESGWEAGPCSFCSVQLVHFLSNICYIWFS